MKKKAWNQNLVVVGLSMLVVVMSMTTKPASAKMGEVRRYQKISETTGNGPDLDVNDRFGRVAGIGDLDKDGVRDIAVGANADDDGVSNGGAVYVLFMNPDGTVKSYQKISQTNAVPELGKNYWFGISVAGIGDLDADGVEDIAAGAYGEDASAGAVYVLFMNTNGTVKSYEKICRTNGVPELAGNDWFGYSVAGIGDLDEDGVEDIAAGACLDDDGATDAGAVYVLFMNTNGTVNSYQKISQTNGVPELAAIDRFGGSVAGIGDLDKDGIEDIVVGAGSDDDGDGDDSGAVYVLFMNTNGTVKSYQKISETSGNGPELDPGDRFSSNVAGIGDLDKDGDEDIAVGALYDDDGDQDDAGAVYVLFMNTRAFTIFSSY